MVKTKAQAKAAPLDKLPQEEKLFQKELRKFAKEKIQPIVSEMDEKQEMSRELLDELFELGVMGIEIPEEHGGSGGSYPMSILAIEELARVDPSVAVVIHVQNVLVNKILLQWGSEEQKKRFLPALAKDTVGAYCLSEAESGSDAFAMKTLARREGDSFVLNGSKMWATNAAEAGLFLIFVNADPDKGARGVTAFLLEPSMPGFSLGKREEKMGIRASSQCEVVLDNVRVPAENMIGNVGNGAEMVSEGLNKARVGIAAQMVGLAQGALDAALAYAQERKQFGQMIAQFQGIHFPLAEMATEVEAARLLVYNAMRQLEEKAPYFKLIAPTAMAKYFASQVAERVASQAVEIFGGYGFSREYPVEKFYRDAKVGKIYEGTSNIQLRTIASTMIPRLK